MIAVAKNYAPLDDDRIKLIERHAGLPDRITRYLLRRSPWLLAGGADLDSIANAAFLEAARTFIPPGNFVAFAAIVIRRRVCRDASRARGMLPLPGDVAACDDRYRDLREAIGKLSWPVRKAIERHFGIVDGPTERLARRDEAALISKGLEQLRTLLS